MMTFQTVSERFTGCSVSCVAANSSANRWFSFRSRSFSDCRSMLKGYILLSRLNRSPEISIHSVRRAGSFVKRVANSLALPGAACSARLQQTSMPEQLQKNYDSESSFTLDRRLEDPEGAITTARTLIETVYKHILDDAGVE